MLDFLINSWYLFVIVFLYLCYYIYSYFSDLKADYTNKEITYYTDNTGTFVYVPRYILKPNYNKAVEKIFNVKGNPIKNNNVDTGYIKITEKLGIEKISILGFCYKYKYERYNEKEIFNIIIEKVEQLNNKNITNNDILFLKQINENLENVTNNDKEKAIELLETITEIIPGIGGFVKVILTYIRLYKI